MISLTFAKFRQPQVGTATLDRRTLVEAMAMASWQATGEVTDWHQLPVDTRHDWMQCEEAALMALEQAAPAVRMLFSE